MSETDKTKKTKTIPFYPDHLNTEIRVVWILIGIAFLIGVIAIFSPVGLEEPADPMVTPDHVKPEWYFLGLYQLLKYVPKTLGVVTPILGIFALLVLPFFSKKQDSKKQIRYRLIGSILFVIVFIALTLWGWYS